MKVNSGQKVAAGFGLALVFLAALAWFGYFIPRRFIALTEKRRESVQVVEHLAAFLSLMKDVETGQRGYLLTGQEEYLEPYRVAREASRRELSELRVLTAGQTGSAKLLAVLEDLARRKISELERTIALRRGDPEHGLAEALEIVRSGEGKRLMDQIRSAVEEWQAAEAARRDAAAGAADTAARRLLWLSSLLGPVALLLVAGSGWIVLRDLAARGRAEEQVKLLNVELEERVQSRTAELSESNRSLIQRNREVETFVYSVSHDLRSPLVNLQGFGQELRIVGKELRALLEAPEAPESIRSRGLALLDGEMGEAIQFIQSAVMRLSNIIDALLRLSRAGRVVYEWQLVELGPIVQRIVEAQAAVAAEKGAAIEVGPLSPVWGDPTALEQVFANLIGNALNYLDPQRPGWITIGMLETGNGAAGHDLAGMRTIFVKDNGLGIPDDLHNRVFHAFQRLHPESSPGEGIGLTLVGRIVERHGGKIWFESGTGAGTTFFVSIPARSTRASSSDIPLTSRR